ncbi:hypothetical protein EGW08_020482 [Elysia chlorotica]|uniref:WAP domain-containing protein n=1 Tax=Elysia chlorotica TaxID=188477 RepID=A0A433SRJ2_ELYCH|nr:hypothetical protein EGW08_020482 [Elysia chlorotica]
MWKAVLSLIVAGLCVVSAQPKPDPRCIEKNCAAGTTCRIVKTCSPPSTSCVLEPQCLANPPKDGHRGVCIIGEPILVQKLDRLRDLTCGPSSPCPMGAYCNTDLMDTYAMCCMSDPVPPVRNWTCPANTYTDDDFCLDTCNNDGDCRHDAKCCEHGCNKECLHPPDICEIKKCPSNSYCQRKDFPRCSAPGECHSEGDCVPCPPVCEIFCQHGNVLDPNGCKSCLCKPPPPPSGGPPPPQYPSVQGGDRNTGSRPGLFWPGSRLYGSQRHWAAFIPPWLWAIMLLQN